MWSICGYTDSIIQTVNKMLEQIMIFSKEIKTFSSNQFTSCYLYNDILVKSIKQFL